MRRRNMLDKFGRAHEPADTPSGSVEVLARGADGDGEALNLGGERGDSRKGNVVQAVVDLVGENDDLVLDAQVANLLKLLLGEDLADGVVCVILSAKYALYLGAVREVATNAVC